MGSTFNNGSETITGATFTINGTITTSALLTINGGSNFNNYTNNTVSKNTYGSYTGTISGGGTITTTT